MTDFNTAQYAFKNAVNLFNDNNLNESIEQLNEILKIQEEEYWNMTHEELEKELAKDIQQFLDEQEEE